MDDIKLELSGEETIEYNGLKKYYKEVKRCSRCSRLYGLDLKKEIKNLCPVCLYDANLNNKKRGWNPRRILK